MAAGNRGRPASERHLSASQIGVVFATFGVGGVVAASALGRVVDRLGSGRLLWLAFSPVRKLRTAEELQPEA